jgi:competence protein ComEC
MIRFILLAYCLGIGLVTFLPSLEDWPKLVVGLILVLALSLRQGQLRPLLPLLACGFMLGCVWHLHWASQRLGERLAKPLEGVDLTVSGQVASLPVRFDLIQQFVFDISAGEQGVRGTVRLNYYGDEPIEFGDYLKLVVRLNRPHGLANPGSFDREAHMLRRGIVASGYVREVVCRDRNADYSLVSVRAEIARRLKRSSIDSVYGGLILALVLGEKAGISANLSELFAETGTSHLFVISGLHIGLVAGVVFWLVSLLAAACPPLLRYLPRQKIAGIAGLASAIGYSALAGFTLPTQRAVVMLGVFLVSSLLARETAPSIRLLYALALVLTLDPLATTSAGFWFSFLAVAGLLYSMSFSPHWPPSNTVQPGFGSNGQWLTKFIAAAIKPQVTIFTVLLVPLLFFGGAPSIFSPLINTLAIPFVGLVIVPLCLLFALFTFIAVDFAAVLFSLIEWLFYCLITTLEWFSQQQYLIFGEPKTQLTSVGLLAWLCAIAGVVLGLAPVRKTLKLLALPLLLPLFWPARGANKFELAVHILDVGQGLAIVLQTANHTLAYDTGFGIADGYSAGQSVVVPALQSLGVRQLDALVISHGDNDHIGGLAGVLEAFPDTKLLTTPTVIASLEGAAQNCKSVQPWQWDGVLFEFLSVNDSALSSNNQSCVLRVSTSSASVLLPGDIERDAELLLATQFTKELASDLLIAPHHGSKSSSSYPFLKLVQPQMAIVSAGYNNRFGHPSQAITQRYDTLGIDYWVTHEEGMISVFYPWAASAAIAPRSYRKSVPRYWR